MKTKLKLPAFFEYLIPCMLVGIAIALLVSLLIMFFYIAVWGLIIGVFIWLFTLIKQILFPNKIAKPEEGRIIEHDDKI